MHHCVNEFICSFAIFGLIFTEFLPNCTAKELGRLFSIFGSFCSFLDSEGANIGPLNRPHPCYVTVIVSYFFQLFL